MSDRITLNIDKDRLTGGVQVSINVTRPNGAGHGYRILGPKYSGSSEPIAQTTLTARDAEMIRKYLDKVSS